MTMQLEKLGAGQTAFLRKSQALLQDSRPWKERLWRAALAAFAFCYTVFFFGPVELAAYNQDFLVFSVRDAVRLMAIFALLGFAGLTLLLSVLRGRFFNYALSVLFAITVGAYLQGNVFNGTLGLLNGEGIAWEKETLAMLGNLLGWGAVLLCVLCLHYFSKPLWRKAISAVCALLVLMQTAALASMALAGLLAPKTQEGTASYLSAAHQFEFSRQGNILVILLDEFDYKFAAGIEAQDPAIYASLDGFTQYTNAISSFARTRPGANAILTGYSDGVYHTPPAEYFANSWTQSGQNLLLDLSNAGYEVDLYGELGALFGNDGTAARYVWNAVGTQDQLDAPSLIKSLLELSAYRYAPIALKPFFWSYTGDINNQTAADSDIYRFDDAAYWEGIANAQVTLDRNCFKFYHMEGAHHPYTLGRDGQRSDTTTNPLIQSEGCFRILMKLFAWMKEAGIYKDTAIIITADHGHALSFEEPLSDAVRIGLFYKPAGCEGTPFATSDAPVSNSNIRATVLKNAGLDYSAYGPALDEVQPGQAVERFFYKTVGPDSREKTLYIYRVGTDASDFSSWELIGSEPVDAPFFG